MTRLIIGTSGAAGSVYRIRLLEVLASHKDIGTHFIITDAARWTIGLETDFTLEYVTSSATCVYDVNDVAASISRGSFHADGMVVAPCSVKTLSAIAISSNNNVLVRAADVCLKQRRKLVLLFRETPLDVGRLRQMPSVAEMGAILLPPSPRITTVP